jgi:hypothetical protein
MNLAVAIVLSLTAFVFLFVCSVMALVIWDAKNVPESSESGSIDDPLDVNFSDNEDDVFDGQNISLKYFGRGRSSLTELYMKSFSFSEATIPTNNGPIFTTASSQDPFHNYPSFRTGAEVTASVV